MSAGIWLRVRRTDNDLVLIQRFLGVDVLDAADTLGEIDGTRAIAALDQGYPIVLEMMDPDGGLATAGEWQLIDSYEGWVFP